MTLPVSSSKVSNSALVAERHAQLVKATTSLLLRQGFHKTSVRQIAASAGWQMGTLYLYIDRKEDVLFLISKAIMNELSEGLLAIAPRSTPSETLWIATDYFFSAVDRLRSEISLLYRESASLMPDQLAELKDSELKERAYFARIIREGIATGEFEAPVEPELFAHDIIMLAHMWALKGWALFKTFPFERYKASQMELLWKELTRGAPPANLSQRPADPAGKQSSTGIASL